MKKTYDTANEDLADVRQALHLVSEEADDWPVPPCFLNPAKLNCVACKGFKGHGICSHVLAVNHILKRVNLRREVMGVGQRASKKPGGNTRRPAPALTRAPARELDSSDEEEERLLALGASGK